MKHTVVLTRRRTIEERVTSIAITADPADAIASVYHLLDGGLIDWRYERTISFSEPIARIVEPIPPK